MAVAVSTLDGNDINVTGPGGTQAASFLSIDVNADGTPRTATYALSAPGGTWDAADNGTYTIALHGNQVDDTAGNSAAGGNLGTFDVNIAGAPPPPTPGPVDLSGTTGLFNVVQDPATAGRSVEVEFGIQNTESGDAGAFVVDFYISTNSWISHWDNHLGSRTIDGLTGNSTTGILAETLALPAGDDRFWRGDDTYYIGMIIDDADAIDETNDRNNYRIGQDDDRDSLFVSLSPLIGQSLTDDLGLV